MIRGLRCGNGHGVYISSKVLKRDSQRLISPTFSVLIYNLFRTFLGMRRHSPLMFEPTPYLNCLHSDLSQGYLLVLTCRSRYSNIPATHRKSGSTNDSGYRGQKNRHLLPGQLSLLVEDGWPRAFNLTPLSSACYYAPCGYIIPCRQNFSKVRLFKSTRHCTR